MRGGGASCFQGRTPRERRSSAGWRRQLDELEQTIAMTSRGNVIHKHLVDEARERVLREMAAAGTTLTDAQVTREMLCDELDRMLREFRRSGNTGEWKKTISTQKGLNCRPSRNSRE